MGADQEICDDPIAVLFGFLRPLSPELTSKLRGRGRHRIEEDSQGSEVFAEGLVSLEVSADLSPYDLTCDESPCVISDPERLSRSLSKLRVGAEDIEKDRGVDRCLHFFLLETPGRGPRISSRRVSTGFSRRRCP